MRQLAFPILLQCLTVGAKCATDVPIMDGCFGDPESDVAIVSLHQFGTPWTYRISKDGTATILPVPPRSLLRGFASKSSVDYQSPNIYRLTELSSQFDSEAPRYRRLGPFLLYDYALISPSGRCVFQREGYQLLSGYLDESLHVKLLLGEPKSAQNKPENQLLVTLDAGFDHANVIKEVTLPTTVAWRSICGTRSSRTLLSGSSESTSNQSLLATLTPDGKLSIVDRVKEEDSHTSSELALNDTIALAQIGNSTSFVWLTTNHAWFWTYENGKEIRKEIAFPK